MKQNTSYKGSMDPEIIDLATPCSYERSLAAYCFPVELYEQRQDKTRTVKQELKKSA